MTISNQYTVVNGVGIIPEGTTKLIRPSNKDTLHALRSIRIPKTVTDIDFGALWYCPNIEEIVVDEGNYVYDSREGCNAIIHTESNTLIHGCKNSFIPDTIEVIGKWAFYKKEITEIFIPSSVYEIQNGAFSNCSHLKQVTLSEGVTDIGAWAFCMCSKLKQIHLPESLEELSNEVFIGCKSLQSLHIPANVNSLDSYLTSGCDNLKSITVAPANKIYDSRENCNAIIESASNYLLIGCAKTRIPNNVTRIRCGAFASLNKLEYIIIPESVVDIEEHAFHGNVNLEAVTIKGPLRNLRETAFAECKALQYLTLPAGIKKVSATFKDCKLKEIEVPYQKMEYYKRRLPEHLHRIIVGVINDNDIPFDQEITLIVEDPITPETRKKIRQSANAHKHYARVKVSVLKPEEYNKRSEKE